MDFAKAFDTVMHSILLDKLNYDVGENAFNLIKSYLSNRMQCTVNNKKISKMLSITKGILQGSILGLFLFLVYINDLPNSCNSDIMLYADDAVLLCSNKTSKGLKHNCKKSKNRLNLKSNMIKPIILFF